MEAIKSSTAEKSVKEKEFTIFLESSPTSVLSQMPADLAVYTF